MFAVVIIMFSPSSGEGVSVCACVWIKPVVEEAMVWGQKTAIPSWIAALHTF